MLCAAQVWICRLGSWPGGGLEEKDCEDRHDGFERVAEAGLDRDEVVGEGQQGEGPREEDGSGDALLQCKREAEESGEADEAIVENAEGFVQDSFFGGFGDADPVEVKTLECELEEAELVGADLFACELSFPLYEGLFAHLFVFEIDGADVADRDASADGEAVVGVEDGVVQLGAEVAADGDEGV